MEDLVPIIIDYLTLGDMTRLYEALCDRGTRVPSELHHVLYTRLNLTCSNSHISRARTWSRNISSHMTHSKTRCRECGAHCRRLSHVCFDCARDPRSYRSMVSRNDLRKTPSGWNIKERILLRALSTIRVVTITKNGGYMYWRREAEESLARVLMSS